MRILVIEDNHRLNSSLASSLTHEGYSVDNAYDGQEGQDLAEITPYDLILLDVLLPGKDGLEVCRDLRRRRIHTPILLLTALDSVDDRVQGLDCGADDYLVKPFAMRELLARLEAAFKRQARFTADASHELRTPLTIIDLEINRALTQFAWPEDHQRVLEQIQTENAQMASIVNSLLLLARSDTGQMTLDLQEVDLSDLALASVERLVSLARQCQITLATGDLPEVLVRGDPHYLGQMLTNLVENGIKYSSGIGKRVSVSLACEQDRWGIVRVQDDGPGIAEEHLPSLFERFYRVDKARARGHQSSGQEEPGGSGLGLSIVQWIVQAHGGQIRVTSTVGAGSLFEVRLPLLKPAEE